MTSSIARSEADLSTPWFRTLFHHIGNTGAAGALDSSEVKAIGTGQMGFVVKARLHYGSRVDKAPDSLIIKLSSPDETARQTGLALGIYQAEVNFYREIAPRTSMQLPNCLFADCDHAGWLTIVLEDMSDVATQGDVLAGGSVGQAKSAVTELAKLQAPFWDSQEWLEKTWLSPQSATPLYEVPPLCLSAFLERFAHALTDKQTAIFQEAFPRAREWLAQWHKPMSLTHGDFRLDNILLATSDAAPAMTTIDWQTVKMAPPLIDVAYYLGACLPVEVRREHEQGILKHYQSELAARGVDYPWEQLWEDYRFCAIYGVLLCAFAVKVPQTERGDKMFISTAIKYAEMALDLDALTLLR